MAINLSLRPYQIFSYYADGSNGLNLTPFCSGESSGFLSISESEPDDRGIIYRTGRLVLDITDKFINSDNNLAIITDGSLSGYDVWQPSLNNSRWAIGGLITIYVAQDDEILSNGNRLGDSPIYSLFHKFRILKRPFPPYRGNMKLEIEIADELTLFSWRSPDDDASQVSVGTSTSRDVIVGRLLSRAGIDNWIGSIPSYPLSYPIPKAGGSFIEQAGRVAIGGLKWIYSNKNLEIDATEVDFEPTSVFRSITLGINDVDFQPLQGERPASEVTVSGVGYDTEEGGSSVDSGSVTTYEYAPGSAVPVWEFTSEGAEGAIEGNDPLISPETGESVRTWFVRNTNNNDSNEILIRERRESWNWSSDGRRFTREILINECRGLLINDEYFYLRLGSSPPTHPYTLVTSEFTQTVDYYDDRGFLDRQETTSVKPIGSVNYGYYDAIAQRSDVIINSLLSINYLALIDAYRKSVTYEYKGTQTRKIETKEYKTLGEVAGSAEDWGLDGETDPAIEDLPNPQQLIVSNTELEQWEPARNIIVLGGTGNDNPLDEWRKTEQTRSTGVSGSTISSLSLLALTNSTVRVTNNGQDQPPAANTRRPDAGTVEREFKGTASLEPLADDDFAPRERQYRIDYATSNIQCERLAEIFGAFLYGRHEGFQVTMAFSDSWFDYTPLRRIDVINPIDVTEQRLRLSGLTSGVTFVFAADRAVVTANCLKIGHRRENFDDDPDDIQPVVRPYKFRRRTNVGQGQQIELTILTYGTTLTAVTLQFGQGQRVEISKPLFVNGTASVGVNVSGTIASRFSGSASVGVDVTGTIADNTTSFSGSASVGVNVSGSFASVTPVNGSSEVGVNVSGTITDTTVSFSGAPEVGINISGTIIGTESFSGAGVVGINVSGTIVDTTTSFSGSASVGVNVSGTFAVVYAVSGAASVGVNVSGTIAPAAAPLGFTAEQGESYTYLNTSNNFPKIWDGLTTTGAIKSSGGTSNEFYVFVTLTSISNVSMVKVNTGQSNGAFNQPTQLRVYSGHLSHASATSATPLSTHTLATGSTALQSFSVSYSSVQQLTLRFSRSSNTIAVLEVSFDGN